MRIFISIIIFVFCSNPAWCSWIAYKPDENTIKYNKIETMISQGNIVLKANILGHLRTGYGVTTAAECSSRMSPVTEYYVVFIGKDITLAGYKYSVSLPKSGEFVYAGDTIIDGENGSVYYKIVSQGEGWECYPVGTSSSASSNTRINVDMTSTILNTQAVGSGRFPWIGFSGGLDIGSNTALTNNSIIQIAQKGITGHLNKATGVLDILKACSINQSSIVLNHGLIKATEIVGNTKKQNITISCNGKTKVYAAIKYDSVKDNKINLDNGVDSIFNLTSSTGEENIFNVEAGVNKIVEISSTLSLRNNEKLAPGYFNKSVVVEFTYD